MDFPIVVIYCNIFGTSFFENPAFGEQIFFEHLLSQLLAGIDSSDKATENFHP